MRSKKAGFTLVELALVLVIIGLIIGGVLVGRDLIKAAELRNVVSQFNEYKAAIYTFRTRFDGYPGDFNNATGFWEAAPVCDIDEAYSGDFSVGTCNGNQDGKIGTAVCGTAATSPCYEWFTFWQHLSLAELIKGNYGADLSTVTDLATIIPNSQISQSWSWRPTRFEAGIGTSYFDATAGRNLLISGAMVDADSRTITPEDAFAIDSKMDDGQPATGKVTVFNGMLFPDCTENADGSVTDSDDKDALYKVATPELACLMAFSY